MTKEESFPFNEFGYDDKYVDFTAFKGKKVANIFLVERYEKIEEIGFVMEDGSLFKMYHEQDCCESVHLESPDAEEIRRLIGQEILEAYETEGPSDDKPDDYGTHTWTFYTIRTMLDTIVLRWYGESNGYYSESVNIKEKKQND